MNIFYLLIGVSLLVALIFLGIFIWAVRNGQFEDNETPAIRMLFDDEPGEANGEEVERSGNESIEITEEKTN